MSTGYRAVQWNRHKQRYDAVLIAAICIYLASFVAVTLVVRSGDHAISVPILAMRALGSCAFVLLHIILCIGPLARLDRRFLPLLYNRRHLGVATFGVALCHFIIAMLFYHAGGVLNPFVSLLSSNINFLSLRAFPYQILGLLALIILFLMAATSHDFWLKNLTPATWKRLHMLVYIAYGLLVGHVALGALQSQRGVFATILVGVGAVLVVSLHIASGRRERRADGPAASDKSGWIDAGLATEIPLDRARIICPPSGERIALFRHAGGISAVTNVCAHQGGPLGEGQVIDGCITCPWHGWQYRPGDGCSPPPFAEKVATYQVRIVDGRAHVDPRPLPPGTPVTPATIEAANA